jgi:hypothetical protein
MQYPGLLYSKFIVVNKDTCKKVHVLVTWSLATDKLSECSVCKCPGYASVAVGRFGCAQVHYLFHSASRMKLAAWGQLHRPRQKSYANGSSSDFPVATYETRPQHNVSKENAGADARL